jgi:hypothetical protein
MFIETTVSQDHDPNDHFEPIQTLPLDLSRVYPAGHIPLRTVMPCAAPAVLQLRDCANKPLKSITRCAPAELNDSADRAGGGNTQEAKL